MYGAKRFGAKLGQCVEKVQKIALRHLNILLPSEDVSLAVDSAQSLIGPSGDRLGRSEITIARPEQ